jgi:hypothetical protein
MRHNGRIVFLLLILSQGAHSIEEYITKLYGVFAPARFVRGPVSDDLALGFAVANVALVTFGLWCWACSPGPREGTDPGAVGVVYNAQPQSREQIALLSNLGYQIAI